MVYGEKLLLQLLSHHLPPQGKQPYPCFLLEEKKVKGSRQRQKQETKTFFLIIYFYNGKSRYPPLKK